MAEELSKYDYISFRNKLTKLSENLTVYEAQVRKIKAKDPIFGEALEAKINEIKGTVTSMIELVDDRDNYVRHETYSRVFEDKEIKERLAELAEMGQVEH